MSGLALVLGMALAGCAGQVGSLAPTNAIVPGTTQVDMLAATTRAPSPEAGVLFSGERGAVSRSALVISIPNDDRRQIGQVQWPRTAPPDPATEFASVSVEPLQDTQVDRWLRTHASRKHRVLIFVHGFNTSFESAVFRFAQIYHDAGAEAAPVLFSWPSRGRIFDYAYDRESANFSRDALENLLREVAQNTSVNEITVLAHSMGAWLTMETLRQMAIHGTRLPSKIRTVVLASPDVDVDVFRVQLDRIGTPRPRIVVFLSQEDRALGIARRLAGNVERLGRIDPAVKPWITEKGVELVDLTGMDNASWLNHGKFAENEDVVRFLGEQLINSSSQDFQTGLGERVEAFSSSVAQGVGGAASLALGAPLAIVSPRSRAEYTSRIDHIRESVESSVSEAIR